MASADFDSIAIALPRIAEEFHSDLASIQWIPLGYAVAVSSFLLPAGKVGDSYSRKGAYILGYIVFGLGCLLAGLSHELWMLIAFRIIAAAGSAILLALGMAIITSTFEANERGRAIGLYMTVTIAGNIIGPVFGGILVESLGWRSVFFVNIPLVLLGMTAVSLIIRHNLSNARPARGRALMEFDWLGLVLSGGTLLAALISLSYVHKYSWTGVPVMSGLIVSAILLVLFIRHQANTAHPLLDLSLFKSRIFAFGSLSALFAFVAAAPVWILLPFYLQQVLNLSPGRTGLIMMANAASLGVMAPIGGRISDKYGTRIPKIVGAMISAIGLFLLGRLALHSNYSDVLPGLILLGAGIGIFHASNLNSLLGTVHTSKYGVASAFTNLNRNMGNSLGLALATAIVSGIIISKGYAPSEIVAVPVVPEVKEAFTAGIQIAFWVGLGLMVAVIALSCLKTSEVQRKMDSGDGAKTP